jgi:hypothetical protein
MYIEFAPAYLLDHLGMVHRDPARGIELPLQLW